VEKRANDECWEVERKGGEDERRAKTTGALDWLRRLHHNINVVCCACLALLSPSQTCAAGVARGLSFVGRRPGVHFHDHGGAKQKAGLLAPSRRICPTMHLFLGCAAKSMALFDSLTSSSRKPADMRWYSVKRRRGAADRTETGEQTSLFVRRAFCTSWPRK
jgi:hypothetical protein